MTIKKDVLTDIHPRSLLDSSNTFVHEFDNKYDFVQFLDAHPMDKYAEDVRTFKKEIKELEMDPSMIEKVSNTVRNNLIKRGIITGTVYEGYKYDVDGDIIDYAELATGNPRCMMKPLKKYDKYFYELYINMSIPWSVDASDIEEGAIRLIETIKALEELNIEIKLNVVLFSRGMYTNGTNYLFIMHLANHLEFKDYRLILPYINGNFLRGPLFNTMYKQGMGSVDDGLGQATKLKNSVNLWELDEVALAERVLLDLDMKV